MSIDLVAAEAFIHEKIPITRAMGVRVVACDGGELVLEAPLALNHNHLGTAFGGSLGSMAMLTGYALLWLELRNPGCHVVVRDCSMNFQRPVRGDIRAVGTLPEKAVMDRFRQDLARKSKARISLEVRIVERDRVALEFRGTFVAMAVTRS